MPSADESTDIAMNVISKVIHYQWCRVPFHQELTLIVYGDREPTSYRMWKRIFRDELNVSYSTEFPPIPIPAHYTPKLYEQYEKKLREFVSWYVADKNLIWGLYNLAAPEQDPRMHLVLASRRLQRSELRSWAHIDKSEFGRWLQYYRPTRRESFGSPSAFREVNDIVRADYEGGSDAASWSAPRVAFLREISRLDEGESTSESSSSSLRSSQSSLIGDLSPTDSGEVNAPRSIKGSSKESRAADRSSRRKSASLSLKRRVVHHDPRYISVARLRGLVFNLLDFVQVTSIPER